MLRRLLDSPWTYFSLAALLALGGLLSMVELKLPTRPIGAVEELQALRERDDVNVVFVLVDTLRADRLGSYGYERPTSPFLDYLAETGVRFTHVQAQSSWTKCSMASLWTGVTPRRTGVLRYPDALSEEAVTPAERLREAGFRTAGIFRNGWVDSNFGFGQGFESYIHPKASATPERLKRQSPGTDPLMGTDLEITQSALEFLRSNAHERFFLYLHYMDVHQYVSDGDQPSFGNSFSDAYDNAIVWTDRNLSALYAALEERGVLDRTIFVLVADHGEAFREHGSEGHAKNLYREVTETPWIIALPFRVDRPAIVTAPVSNVDVWPTLYDLLGLAPSKNVDGRSRVAEIENAMDPAVPIPEPSIALLEIDKNWGQTSKEPVPIVGLVDGPYRYLFNSDNAEKPELYDRSSDPTEQVNIAAKHPDLVARYQKLVDEYLASDVAWSVPQVELDAMRLGQLRALGYAVEK